MADCKKCKTGFKEIYILTYFDIVQNVYAAAYIGCIEDPKYPKSVVFIKPNVVRSAVVIHDENAGQHYCLMMDFNDIASFRLLTDRFVDNSKHSISNMSNILLYTDKALAMSVLGYTVSANLTRQFYSDQRDEFSNNLKHLLSEGFLKLEKQVFKIFNDKLGSMEKSGEELYNMHTRLADLHSVLYTSKNNVIDMLTNISRFEVPEVKSMHHSILFHRV